MEFENLKGLLGEAYHEGITAEEVNNFFAGKSFADLSTGQYVDKNKYERDIQNLNNTINEQKNKINSKLTDDERKEADFKAKEAEIERLNNLLKQNTITSNSDLVKGTMTSTKALLDIKEDDSDFNAFIDNIVSDDRNKSNSIATYFTKLVKDAYDKGAKDSNKNAMGEFGKGYKSGGNGGKKKEEESLGSKLGKSLANTKKDEVNYFKRG